MEEPVWTCGAPSAVIAHLGLEDETAKEVSESSGKEWGIREGETLRHKIIVDMNVSAAVMEVCELVGECGGGS